MDLEEKKSKILNDSQIVLFGFELNRSQTTMVLIVSLIGLFTTTIEFTTFFISTLFNQIIDTIYGTQSNIDFSLLIVKIIVLSISFYLSLYGLKKILRQGSVKNKNKRKFIPQDIIVHWLGLKLSQGQAFFIFCLSLVGLLYVFQFYFEFAMVQLFRELSSIPVDPNSFLWHENLANIGRFVICIIFMVFCLYSLIICRRGKPASPSNKFVKNYGLVIYIVSFIIFVFNFVRFYNHLYFSTDLVSDNEYQRMDFLSVIVIAVICCFLMISTYFLKERPDEDPNMKKQLTWLRIKLTEIRAVLLLSFAILGIIYFSYFFFWYYSIISGSLHNFQLSSVLIIPLIFIILSYYAINTVLKKNRLNYFINKIINSKEITCKWFKFELNRLDSVIILCLSCGFIVFNVVALVLFGISTRAAFIYIDQGLSDFTSLISNAIMTVFFSLLLVFNRYTIKRTKSSIKSS